MNVVENRKKNKKNPADLIWKNRHGFNWHRCCVCVYVCAYMTAGNQFLVASSFLRSSSHYFRCFPLHRFAWRDWLKCSQKSGRIAYGIVAPTKGQIDERGAGFLSAECVWLLRLVRRSRARQHEHADKWRGESCHRPSAEVQLSRAFAN